MYNAGQMLSARLDAQWSADDYLLSAEQFYIGGMYSVRGYEESFLGGLTKPKQHRPFAFLTMVQFTATALLTTMCWQAPAWALKALSTARYIQV